MKLFGKAAWLICSTSIVYSASADAPRSLGEQSIATKDVETMVSEVSAAESKDAGQAQVTQIFQSIIDLIVYELEQGQHQGANAFLAFFIGCVLLFNGRRVFDLLLVSAVAYLVAIMAMNALGTMWGLGMESDLRHFVGVEVALIGAWGTWKGIKGFDLYAFAFFGFVIARTTQHFWVHIGLHFMDTINGNKWVVWAYYTIVVVVFLYFSAGKAHKLFMAIVTPVMGSLLVVSAIAFGITEYCVYPVHGIHIFGFLEKIWPDVTPMPGAWVNFLQTLCSQSTKDYGIFAGSTYGPANPMWSLDRIVGWIFCLLLTCVGIAVQLKFKDQDTEDDTEDESVDESKD